MHVVADRSETLTAIRTDLGAILVSLELSHSTWLITSLSPGGGEKLSKHSVPSGDLSALFRRFDSVREKARGRMGRDLSSLSRRPGSMASGSIGF